MSLKTFSYDQAVKYLNAGEDRLRYCWHEPHFKDWLKGKCWVVGRRMPLADLNAYAKDSKKELEALRRKRDVVSRRRYWEVCWHWKPEVGGRAEVETWAKNLTTGEEQHYCAGAECRIESISDDGETFILVIDYLPGNPRECRGLNGTRLQVDICELWAPVHFLHPQVVACRESRAQHSDGSWDVKADEAKLSIRKVEKKARRAIAKRVVEQPALQTYVVSKPDRLGCVQLGFLDLGIPA